ncbi:hypothetical protein ACWEBX_40705 [Streptomyces sp. NPDC005070]
MTRLKVRAPQIGQALHQHLLELVTREAQQPTLAETAERTGGTPEPYARSTSQ